MLFFSQSHTFTAMPPLNTKVFAQLQFGGPEGDRTLDLCVANAALIPAELQALIDYLIVCDAQVHHLGSQLSYEPI